MTHPPHSTSAEARANEPRWEVMRLERIGWRRVSDAADANPDRRAEMMRDANQAVDVLNRLSRGPPPAPNGLRTPTIKQQRRALRSPPPDGLRTPDEAARKLGCSVKTLNGHLASGALRYVLIGHGRKRRRMMFTDRDIDDFIANQTRKDAPCPSTAGRARPTGISTFTGEVIDFTGPRKPPTSAKRRK
jgi:helix-turn-helix protein